MYNPAQVKTLGFDKIMIDVTTRCNLKCSVCYRTRNSQDDLSFDVLKKLAVKYHGKIVSLCGGEPTLRKDLPEVIKLFSKRSRVFLVTNGIALADYGYLKDLKDSGLQYISFSFNGFSDEVYERIHGRSLLDLKLKALNNVKKAGIETILSVLLVKGLNEGQIGAILKYCLDNRDFIKELRIRTMVPISKYLTGEKHSINELINTVCRESGIEKEDVLRELELKKEINSFFKREIFILRSCSFDFYLRRRGNRFVPAGHNLKIGAPFGWIKTYGIKMLINGLLKAGFNRENTPWIHDRDFFKIGLRSWPDKHDIDMEENKKCRTGYYLNGKELSFCHANILKDGEANNVFQEI